MQLVSSINKEDECLQCSTYGIILPNTRLPVSLVTKYNNAPTDIQSTYKKNTNKLKSTKFVKNANDHCEEDKHSWTELQKEVTAVIVTDGQNKSLSLYDVSSIEKEWKDLYFVPSLNDMVWIRKSIHLLRLKNSKRDEWSRSSWGRDDIRGKQ